MSRRFVHHDMFVIEKNYDASQLKYLLPGQIHSLKQNGLQNLTNLIFGSEG